MFDDLLSAKRTLVDLIGEASLDDKRPDDFSIFLDGEQLPVDSGRVLRTMDTAADSWTAVIRWDPSDERVSKLTYPVGFQSAECYLGRKLVVNGFLYNVKHRVTINGLIKELQAFSPTVDIIDSVVKPPLEQTKVTLEDRARTLTAQFPFEIKYDVTPDEPFDRVTADATEKIFDHLVKLAQQRGVLISSTERGELHFLNANTNGSPVDSISDNFPPGTSFEIEFNSRARFYEYRALSQTPGRKKKGKSKLKTASAFDGTIPEYRFLAFQADEASIGNAQRAADWKRSKTVAEALTIPYPVSGWYDSNGNLWRENTIVTVKSEALAVPDGFNFLIRQVEYQYGSSGTTAVLGLVPPQVYTGDPITEPWGVVSKGWLENLIP